MDSTTINELRFVALAADVDCRTRLNSIDKVASLGNFYGTSRYPIERYAEPTTRGRNWLRLALRKLLKTKIRLPKKIQSGCRRRLLLLKGIALDAETKKTLHLPLNIDGTQQTLVSTRPERPETPEPEKTVVNPVLSEIEEALARYQQEHRGDTA